jgi:hypothetical protein
MQSQRRDTHSLIHEQMAPAGAQAVPAMLKGQVPASTMDAVASLIAAPSSGWFVGVPAWLASGEAAWPGGVPGWVPPGVPGWPPGEPPDPPIEPPFPPGALSPCVWQAGPRIRVAARRRAFVCIEAVIRLSGRGDTGSRARRSIRTACSVKNL